MAVADARLSIETGDPSWLTKSRSSFRGVKSWKRPKTTKDGHFYSPHGTDLSDHKMIARASCARQLHKCDIVRDWRVFVKVYPADRRKRDVDRVLSFVLDALEGAVYENDNQVSMVRARLVREPSKDARIEVVCVADF